MDPWISDRATYPVPLGYKARALMSLTSKGLPILHTRFCATPYSAEINLMAVEKLFPFWAVCVDTPANDGSMLPLFGSNLGTLYADMVRNLHYVYKRTNGNATFIVSEAPDDSTRDANIVCWLDGDVLYGEISYQPMTLRSAWTKGKLFPFQITGGPADVIRNPYHLIKHTMLDGGKYFPTIYNPLQHCQFRLDYLRRIRYLLLERDDTRGYEYEISVMNDGRIVFWQETRLTENRSYILPGYYF